MEVGIGSGDKSFACTQSKVGDLREWIDPADDFNYGEAIKKIQLPPILSVIGQRDHALGHVRDATRFLEEAGARDAKILEVPFGHIDMLSSAKARETVFPKVVSWLKS